MPHRDKHIFAGLGPEIDEPFLGLTVANIRALEDALNTKRDPKTPKFRFSENSGRTVLYACQLFIIFGTTTAVPQKAIVSNIDKWLAQTRELQRTLGLKQKTKTIPKNRMDLQKSYSRLLFVLKNHSFRPLPFLRDVLDAAIASGKFALQVIRDPTYPETKRKEQWFLWVALLAKILSREGFKVSAASGDKSSTDSPFVSFIKTIQALLPEKCHRRITSASIAKGIQEANKRYASLELPELLSLILCWGTGNDDEKHPLKLIKDPKSKRRLEHFLSQISPRPGMSPGNGTA